MHTHQELTKGSKGHETCTVFQVFPSQFKFLSIQMNIKCYIRIVWDDTRKIVKITCTTKLAPELQGSQIKTHCFVVLSKAYAEALTKNVHKHL